MKPFVPKRKRIPFITVEYKREMIRINLEVVEFMKLRNGERVNFYELNGTYLLAKSDQGYKLMSDVDGRLRIRCRSFIKHLGEITGVNRMSAKNPKRYISKRYELSFLSNIEVKDSIAGELILGI